MITIAETERITGSKDWSPLLMPEFNKKYMIDIHNQLQKASMNGKVILPNNPFRFLELCGYNDTNVVIIGKEPYSHIIPDGLAYSSSLMSSSLESIFKEANPKRTNPDLKDWAKQGVLLMNMVLTVEKGKMESHVNFNWPMFTCTILRILSATKKNVVYILWGKKLQQLSKHINQTENLVLTSNHPQANSGFMGCDHFKTCNKYLKAHGKSEIKW